MYVQFLLSWENGFVLLIELYRSGIKDFSLLQKQLKNNLLCYWFLLFSGLSQSNRRDSHEGARQRTKIEISFDTITEGIGKNRLPENFKLVKLEKAFPSDIKDCIDSFWDFKTHYIS